MDSNTLKIGFIGVGEGGSRIAHSFTTKNYLVGVINTALPDCANLNLPDSKKLLLDSHINGAGKNIKIGEAIFTDNKNKVSHFIKTNVVGKVHYLMICIAGGGGSGTGSIIPMINICKGLGIQIGVIYTLPMRSEDSVTKTNCLKGLKELNDFLAKKAISPVILIDNQKISEIFPFLTISKFWLKANWEIVKTFDYFNNIPKRKSIYYSALDSADFARILSSSGFMTFGKSEVKKYNNRLALAEKIQTSIESGLMCSGYDLTQSSAAGIIIIGSERVFDRLPAKSIDYAYDSVKEITTRGVIFKGVYKDESVKDLLIIFSVFGGLGLPQERIAELKEAADLLQNKNNEKFSFDFGENIKNDEDEEDPFLQLLGKKRNRRF
jgi:cell division GTPase FtsZ